MDNTARGGTAGGVSIDGQPVLHYNNLYNNLPYNAEVVSASPVDATHNYWGEVLCTQFPIKIYDGYDASWDGLPDLRSQPVHTRSRWRSWSSPTGLVLTGGGTSVTLTWNPIADLPPWGCRVPGSTEPDITYLVFYGDDPCTLSLNDSPIYVADSTTVTLTGLPGTAQYFSVTAEDYLDRRSAFSNVVPNGFYSTFLPLLTK